MPTVKGSKFCRNCEWRVRASGREKDYQKVEEGKSKIVKEVVEEKYNMNFGILFPLLESCLPLFPTPLCKLISQYTYGISPASSNITFETSHQELTLIRVLLKYELTSFKNLMLDEEGEVDEDVMEKIGKEILSGVDYLNNNGNYAMEGHRILITGMIFDPVQKMIETPQESGIRVCSRCLLYLSALGCHICIRCFTSDLAFDMESDFRMRALKKREEERKRELDWDIQRTVKVDSMPYSFILSLMEYSYAKEAREVVLPRGTIAASTERRH